MPSPFTHWLCGREVLETTKNEGLTDLLEDEKYNQAFNLGTQGPDILFYYGVWPWTKSLGIPELGERLHHEDTGRCFERAVEYIKGKSGTERDLLTAYLCGYLCHYSLDCHTHSYIFYRSGFLRPGEAETNKYAYFHRRFETAVDVLMLRHLLNVKPQKMKIHRLIKVRYEESMAIGRMYEYIVKQVYGERLSAEQVAAAIKTMSAAQRVILDRTGLKKKLLHGIEKKMGKYPMMSSMIYPARIKEEIDYLNLDNGTWALPWDSSVKSNASFVELFAAGVKEASGLCDMLVGCLNGELEAEDALLSIGNRCFSSGVDCCFCVEFMDFECVYEEQ